MDFTFSYHPRPVPYNEVQKTLTCNFIYLPREHFEHFFMFRNDHPMSQNQVLILTRIDCPARVPEPPLGATYPEVGGGVESPTVTQLVTPPSTDCQLG